MKLSSLLPDVLGIVFEYLSVKDIARLAGVNKKFRAVAKSFGKLPHRPDDWFYGN